MLQAVMDDSKADAAPTETVEPVAMVDRLGLGVRPLNAEELRSSDGLLGLVIEKVSGAAERAGVEAGDLLLAVNAQTVTTVDQLRGLAAKPGKSMALLVLRDGARIYVALRLG